MHRRFRNIVVPIALGLYLIASFVGAVASPIAVDSPSSSKVMIDTPAITSDSAAALSPAGAPDPAGSLELGRKHTALAKEFRLSGQYILALRSLEQATQAYRDIGLLEPSFIDERRLLAGVCQRIELSAFEPYATFLKDSCAEAFILRDGDRATVRLILPRPCSLSLNNADVDCVKVERVVEFCIEDTAACSYRIGSISGVKAHSSKKDLWVTLLDFAINRPQGTNDDFQGTCTVSKLGIERSFSFILSAQACLPLIRFVQLSSRLEPPSQAESLEFSKGDSETSAVLTGQLHQ